MKVCFNRVVSTFVVISITAVGLLSWSVFSANAGSDQDPLVTMSYVEKRVQQIVTELKAEISNSPKKGENATKPVSTTSSKLDTESETVKFELVQVEKGSFVYFGAGAEFIIRSGKVSAITTAQGGLSDLTDGKDIVMYQSISANHHILVPREDGRGFTALDACNVMIKGVYTITK